MAWDHPKLLGRIREDKFIEIYFACPRKIRNTLEAKHARKARRRGRRVSLRSERNKAKAALQVREGLVKSGDSEMAEEVLKTWLYDKRPMLKEALDFFEIENEDGITGRDIDAFEKAPGEKIEELLDLLSNKGYDVEDIAIYMAFMQAEHFDEVPRLTEVLGSSAETE